MRAFDPPWLDRPSVLTAKGDPGAESWEVAERLEDRGHRPLVLGGALTEHAPARQSVRRAVDDPASVRLGYLIGVLGDDVDQQQRAGAGVRPKPCH
jgi:hypothetical protein